MYMYVYVYMYIFNIEYMSAESCFHGVVGDPYCQHLR